MVQFFSPGNKSACSEAEFSDVVAIEMSSFRESGDLAESDQLEFRIREVTVQGTQGLSILGIYSDGELLFDSINENWVFAEGNWWSVDSDGSLCQQPSPTPSPPGAFEKADMPALVTGAFDEADIRALLSDDEVAAAIPLVIGRMPPITDMRGLAGAEGMVGKDKYLGTPLSFRCRGAADDDRDRLRVTRDSPAADRHVDGGGRSGIHRIHHWGWIPPGSRGRHGLGQTLERRLDRTAEGDRSARNTGSTGWLDRADRAGRLALEFGLALDFLFGKKSRPA